MKGFPTFPLSLPEGKRPEWQKQEDKRKNSFMSLQFDTGRDLSLVGAGRIHDRKILFIFFSTLHSNSTEKLAFFFGGGARNHINVFKLLSEIVGSKSLLLTSTKYSEHTFSHGQKEIKGDGNFR